MENKNEILKKLGFSDEYLKIIEENASIDWYPEINNSENFENINTNSLDITTPIIEITEKPMNSYFIYNER
jgi:hypothetical protein